MGVGEGCPIPLCSAGLWVRAGNGQWQQSEVSLQAPQIPPCLYTARTGDTSGSEMQSLGQGTEVVGPR